MSTLPSRRAGSWIFPGLVALAVVAGFAAQRGSAPAGLWVFVLVVAGWVITLCLHEFSHAVVALAGGDISVRARGYLTLNPFRYTNVANSLVIPLIALAIGGIPLPGGAVLIESHRLRHRWFSSLISAAGPLSNFLAGIVLTVFASMTWDGSSDLGYGLTFLAVLQFVTAILNVLPIPGFDGFGILAPYLPAATRARIAPIAPWAPLIVFAILISSPGTVLAVLFDPAYALLRAFGGTEAAARTGLDLFQFFRH